MFRAVPIAASLAIMLVSAAPARGQDGARRDVPPPVAPKKKPKLTKPPTLVQGATPEYPPAALAKGLEAHVEVRLKIDATGAVVDVKVPTPVGDGFDQAAIDAARKYTFSPAEWDGVPGPITVATKIHFVIDTQPAPPPPTPRTAPKNDPAARGPPAHGGDYRKKITLEGTALERGTRRKLTGVIVSVKELGVDAITDEKGKFFFHGIPAGSYTIIAFDSNFDRFTRGLTIAPRERLNVRLWMRPKGGNPYESVIEADREVLEVTKRTLHRRQMTTVPGTFGDPIRVIQSLPGLARTPFGTGLLVIRGSNPDDTGVYIDGHRVPLLFHFLGGPSFLNPEFLENIDLYPGGFPARFGRAIGGVVSIETRSAKSDGVHGSVDIDLLDAGGYVRFPVGKNGALAFAGRRSYLDFMLGFFLPDPSPGSTLIVVPIYQDNQARFDYDLKDEGKATLFYFGSSDTLKVLSEDADEDAFFDIGTSISFFRIIATYRRELAKNWNLTMSPAWGRDKFSFSGGQTVDSGPNTGIDFSQTVLGYRMRVEGKLRPNLRLETGFDIESRVATYDLLVPIDDDFRASVGPVDIPPQLLELTADILGFGVHADLAWDVGKLRLIPGIRLDGYVLNGQRRFGVDPRIVARYGFTDKLTGKAYTGLFSQSPQPEGLDYRFGNPALGLERAVHTGLGAEWKLAKNWFADGEVYYNRRFDLARLTRDTVTDPATGEVRAVNFRNSAVGDTIGFELLLKRKVTRRIFGWLSYTLSKSRFRSNPDVDYVPYTFDQRHTLNAVASYKTDGGWEFGARHRLATGRPITGVVGSTFDADTGGYQRVNGEAHAQRRKTFQQLDVRAEKTWLFNTWRIGAYLDIQNVLNTENQEGLQYDYRFKQNAPITSVPFVPTLGVKGQW